MAVNHRGRGGRGSGETYRTLPPQNWHSGPCQPSAHKHWPSSWHWPSFWHRPPCAVQLKALARCRPLKQPWKRSSVSSSRHFRLYLALNVGEVVMLLLLLSHDGCLLVFLPPLLMPLLLLMVGGFVGRSPWCSARHMLIFRVPE